MIFPFLSSFRKVHSFLLPLPLPFLPLSCFSTLRFPCLGLVRDFRAFLWLRFSVSASWRCLCHALWLDVTLRCTRRNWRMCIFAQLIWSVVSVAVVVEGCVSSSFHRYFGLLALQDVFWIYSCECLLVLVVLDGNKVWYSYVYNCCGFESLRLFRRQICLEIFIFYPSSEFFLPVSFFVFFLLSSSLSFFWVLFQTAGGLTFWHPVVL